MKLNNRSSAAKPSYLIVGLVCAFCGLAAGCGAEYDVALARGVINRDGAPVSQGKVLFAPLEKGKPAVGEIQSDGTFVLTTIKTDDGAVPGRHRVTIVGDFKINGKEVHLTCSPPADFSLEVEAGKENEFEINISRDSGWTEIADD